MPLVLDMISSRLPWELVCNIASFLSTQEFLSLVLVNKEHYRVFHEEFVRQNIPDEAGAARDWALLQMYFNALRYDSVDLLKQFLTIVYRDEANGRPLLFKPTRIIGKSHHFRAFNHTPYRETLPFLREPAPLDEQPCNHLQFWLAKRFTYIGLAVQADAPRILVHLYKLPGTDIEILQSHHLPKGHSYQWGHCISTIAKALSNPDARQCVKDEALYFAAKAAFPRTTVLLLARGANPNSRCLPRPRVHGQEAATEEEELAAAAVVIGGTTPIQEVQFHPMHLEEGEDLSENYVIHRCPWRNHIYAVQLVVFPKSDAGYFPLVTGCDLPRTRPVMGPAGPHDQSSVIPSGMCLHSTFVGLGVEEISRRPRRVFRAYRPLHTLLALMLAGGHMGPIEPSWDGINDHTHEQACELNQPGPSVVHGIPAPNEVFW